MAAVAVGYAGYGWRGVLLALTVVVFWLLLQASRALRAMRTAGERPLGSLGGSALMLSTRVRPGMTLLQVIALTGSLGERAAAEAGADESYVWRDAGSDAIRVALRGGRVSAVRLERASAREPAGAAGHAEPGQP